MSSNRSRHRAMKPTGLFFLIVALSVSSVARAEEGQAVAEGATTGYELALHGVVRSELGHEIRLTGVAYEVDGLATLRARAGLVVDVKITVNRPRGRGRETVVERSVTAGADGRFLAAVPLPARTLASPRLEITVHRRGQPGRRFDYGLQTQRPHRIDLLTDRRRYEPGEKVRSWVRVTSVRGGTPVSQSSIRLTLLDNAGRPAGNRTVPTSASGVAAIEMELPESAPNGTWRVRAEVLSGGMASATEQAINVTRRTVERLQASVNIEQQLVSPGGALTGRVVVRTPSGSAVRGARVELHRAAGEPIILQTDTEGVARFETTAPAFLSGDVATQSLEARVVHPAHGTIRASATYLIARVRWMVEATPGAGALVPEVTSEVFLNVSNPQGRPIKAGTKVSVRGAGLPGGRAELTTDDHGLALLNIKLPRGSASNRRSGDCSGNVATSLEVEVQSNPPVTARLCVPVAAKALVLPRAEQAMVAPGSEVTVTVQRRPEVANRPVLVEAIWANRAVAWAWIGARQSRASIALPQGVQGVVELRARPAWPSDRRRPLDRPGATAMGIGAVTAILVRPADAFALEVEPDHELWRVRETAEIRLHASQAPQQGWAAMVVRDEAAHGGEVPWVLEWIREELQEALTGGDTPDNDRFLRASLAGSLNPDGPQAEPPPLINPPWIGSRHTGSYRPSTAAARGVLRDPVARREELLRRGIAPAMLALEQAVNGLGSNKRARRGLVRRAGNRVTFDPGAVAKLVPGRLSRERARTLGGEPLTVAMLTAADRSFTFDAVARRVARARLVRLLHGLFQLSDPDNPHAARAVSCPFSSRSSRSFHRNAGIR